MSNACVLSYVHTNIVESHTRRPGAVDLFGWPDSIGRTVPFAHTIQRSLFRSSQLQLIAFVSHRVITVVSGPSRQQ